MRLGLKCTSLRNVAKVFCYVLSILMLSNYAQANPVLLTIFRGGVNIDPRTDPIMQELERRTGTTIRFHTAAWSEVAQVRNLALAVEEEIDIYHHMNLSPQWIEDGLIIALDEYITPENHPYLSALISSPIFEATKVDGKTYYLPMVAHGWDWVFAIREDWLDRLNLTMPTNEEEFREILLAFSTLDTSGHAVGWQVEGGCQIRRSILPILTTFGVPTSFYDVHANFIIDNNRLQPVATADQTKAALRFINGLYNDRLINTDFPSMTSMPMLNERYLQAGNSGVAWVQNPRNIPIADENARWAYIPPFSAQGYEHTRAVGIANNGWIAVSSVSRNPQKAIDFLEYVNSREGRQLLVAGIESLHHSGFNPDGTFNRNNEAWNRDYSSATYPLYFYVGQGLVHGVIPVTEHDSFEEALAAVEIWEPTTNPGLREVITSSSTWAGASNPFQFLTFPELDDTRIALEEAICVGWTRVITSQPADFETEWNRFLTAWSRAGGDEWVGAYQKHFDVNLQ